MSIGNGAKATEIAWHGRDRRSGSATSPPWHAAHFAARSGSTRRTNSVSASEARANRPPRHTDAAQAAAAGAAGAEASAGAGGGAGGAKPADDNVVDAEVKEAEAVMHGFLKELGYE